MCYSTVTLTLAGKQKFGQSVKAGIKAGLYPVNLGIQVEEAHDHCHQDSSKQYSQQDIGIDGSLFPVINRGGWGSHGTRGGLIWQRPEKIQKWLEMALITRLSIDIRTHKLHNVPLYRIFMSLSCIHCTVK